MKTLYSRILCLLIAGTAAGQAYGGVLFLSLADLENKAVRNSGRCQAAQYEADAAASRAAAQDAARYPKLSIDGYYRYTETVPELRFPFPGSRPVTFGDNVTFSVGPALSWTLWDGNNARNSWLSARAAAAAKRSDASAARRQTLLACRRAYLNLAFASEQTAFLCDALTAARAQYADLRLNLKAGTRSRKDSLAAHQEVLTRERQLSQARADMAQALRDLTALTGIPLPPGVCSPIDTRAADKLPADITRADTVISLEPLEELYRRFEPYKNSQVWDGHPSLAALTSLAESARYAAESAAVYPKLILSGRTSLDHPNGPIIETITQNTAAVSLNWALFDAGQSKNRVLENRSLRDAYSAARSQAANDLRRDREKALDQIAALEDQRRSAAVTVVEADELASITFNAYRNGAVTHIEVENANLRAIEAKNQLAKTTVQLLMNYAVLASIADKE